MEASDVKERLCKYLRIIERSMKSRISGKNQEALQGVHMDSKKARLPHVIIPS